MQPLALLFFESYVPQVGEGKCTWVFVATNDIDGKGAGAKGGAHIMATDTTVPGPGGFAEAVLCTTLELPFELC